MSPGKEPTQVPGQAGQPGKPEDAAPDGACGQGLAWFSTNIALAAAREGYVKRECKSHSSS